MRTANQQPLDAAATARIAGVLVAQRAAGGHRLGVIVADDDPAAAEHAAAILESSGLAPQRRLARLRPRIGETQLRAADLTDFADRYGHEYAAALLPEHLFPADERARLEAACRQEGCDVYWH